MRQESKQEPQESKSQAPSAPLTYAERLKQGRKEAAAPPPPSPAPSAPPQQPPQVLPSPPPPRCSYIRQGPAQRPVCVGHTGRAPSTGSCIHSRLLHHSWGCSCWKVVIWCLHHTLPSTLRNCPPQPPQSCPVQTCTASTATLASYAGPAGLSNHGSGCEACFHLRCPPSHSPLSAQGLRPQPSEPAIQPSTDQALPVQGQSRDASPAPAGQREASALHPADSQGSSSAQGPPQGPSGYALLVRSCQKLPPLLSLPSRHGKSMEGVPGVGCSDRCDWAWSAWSTHADRTLGLW